MLSLRECNPPLREGNYHTNLRGQHLNTMNNLVEKKRARAALAKRLSAYASAGVVATVGGVEVTEAAVVDSAATVTVASIGDSVDVDIDGDGVDDFNFSVVNSFNGANNGGFAQSTFFIFNGLNGNRIGVDGGTADATYNNVNNYLVGFVDSGPVLFSNVNSANVFGPGDATDTSGVMFIRYPGPGGLVYGPGGVFGLEFDIGGEIHFGGAELVSISNDTPREVAFAFQYEDIAGVAYGATVPIPEPSGLALLAIGATGLAHRRRRKED